MIKGDCLEQMKLMADNSIDCIVTDPPYGLKFMGKNWDHGIPGKEFWVEALRICKPGAMLLSFGGTRTYHRLTCEIEDAGWEIRDCLMWIYGSGFPKSHNHFGLEGYGTALKPAYEPIIMAMKPLDGTFAQNAEKWGLAGINIDESRIEIQNKDNIYSKNPHTENKGQNKIYGVHKGSNYEIPKGRWPANVLFDEEAAQILDQQSGNLKSGSGNRRPNGGGDMFSGFAPMNAEFDSSSGGASRFFYCAKASSSERNQGLEGMPDIIAKRTQDGGNDTRGRPIPINKNNHPTVKPLKLMKYLLKLVMPPNPNAVVLDPFAGSGTTLVAAKQLGFNAIGIEKESDYCEIANRRIEAYSLKES